VFPNADLSEQDELPLIPCLNLSRIERARPAFEPLPDVEIVKVIK
jgi:hypothetical protein